MFDFILDYLSGKPKPETMEEVIQRNEVPKCTYCGGTKFYEGPIFGFETHILCANIQCRQWFRHYPSVNHTHMLEDLHKQEKVEEMSVWIKPYEETTLAISDKRMQVLADIIYKQGRELFINNKSASGCLQERKDGRLFHAAYSDNLRLSGYIDAQNDFYKNKLL